VGCPRALEEALEEYYRITLEGNADVVEVPGEPKALALLDGLDVRQRGVLTALLKLLGRGRHFLRFLKGSRACVRH
jgi:hypothetical protein